MTPEVTQKKTLKIKKQPETAAPQPAQLGQEPILDHVPLPIEVPSFKVPMMLAFVAVILFLALMIVQVLELSFYSQPPSAWASSSQQAARPSPAITSDQESEFDMGSEDEFDLESDVESE